jgi:glycerophosphoryl diester phosphodiesterase
MRKRKGMAHRTGRFVGALLLCSPLLALLAPAGCQDPGSSNAAEVRSVAVIGHRGAASIAPENTLAAFRAAHEAGADMFELDVHLSADGVPVVIHDDTLERTTDIEKFYSEWGFSGKVRVSSLTLAQLKKLDAGSWFLERDPFGTIRSGAVSRDRAETFRGEPIPTLEETLRFVDETGFAVNVEIKQVPCFYEGIAERTVALINGMARHDLVLVSSFDHEICRRVKELAPDINVAPLCADRIAAPGVYVADVVGGEVYHPSMTALGCRDGRPVSDLPVNAGDIEAAHGHGVSVNVWTVNDRPTVDRLFRAGVDGIITDYPQNVVRWIRD